MAPPFPFPPPPKFVYTYRQAVLAPLDLNSLAACRALAPTLGLTPFAAFAFTVSRGWKFGRVKIREGKSGEMAGRVGLPFMLMVLDALSVCLVGCSVQIVGVLGRSLVCKRSSRNL